MKKVTRTAAVLLALTLIVSTFTGCSAMNSFLDKRKLEGTWQSSVLKMEFLDGENMIMSVGTIEVEATYQLENGQLTIVRTANNSTTVYDYSLDGDSLTLITSGNEIKFERVTEDSSTTATKADDKASTTASTTAATTAQG